MRPLNIRKWWVALPSVATLAAGQSATVADGSATAAIIAAAGGVLAVLFVSVGRALNSLPDWLMRMLRWYQELWKWRRERWAAPSPVEIHSTPSIESAEDD